MSSKLDICELCKMKTESFLFFVLLYGSCSYFYSLIHEALLLFIYLLFCPVLFEIPGIKNIGMKKWQMEILTLVELTFQQKKEDNSLIVKHNVWCQTVIKKKISKRGRWVGSVCRDSGCNICVRWSVKTALSTFEYGSKRSERKKHAYGGVKSIPGRNIL